MALNTQPQRWKTHLVPEPQAYRGRAMLTLSFPVRPGETLVYSRAHCFRFCADGTLRGGDNSIAATRVNDSWRLGQRLYRELQCSGPVLVRARKTATSYAAHYGPYDLVRSAAGLLSADDATLGICLPTWERSIADSWHEVMLFPVTSTH